MTEDKTLTSVVDHLQELLEEAVSAAVEGEKEVGLIYSAGLDSTVLGYVASKYAKVHAVNIGAEGSVDAQHAKEAEPKLPFVVEYKKITEEDVEEALPVILHAIGEANPLKTAVAIPFYLASETLAQKNIETVLCGQGPDELFGGYDRYLSIAANQGWHALEEALDLDVQNLHDAQLKYDIAVTQAAGVNLKFPYVTQKFLQYASSLPADYKLREIQPNQEPPYACVDEINGRRFIRKYVFRLLAERYNVPENILNRRKKAAQYGSGSNQIIDRLARKHGFKKKAKDEGETRYMVLYLQSLLK
ncbi:Asparagine synthase [uncultured archaeon]|nr:Asparagine synthase [uncultured archaeon]